MPQESSNHSTGTPSAPVEELIVRPPNENASWPMKLAAGIITAAFVAAIFYFAFNQLAYRWNWHSVYEYRSYLFKGWSITIRISIVSLVLSTAIGIIFALLRRSSLLPVRYFGHIYVEAIRGTPLLVQILIFFYVIGKACHVDDRYVAGVLILSCFS